MDWNDRGLVIGARKFGETSLILELMTEQHGRHLGVVRGGRSRAMQPTLQLGNRLNVSWRARIEEQLGAFTIDGDVLRAGRLMESPMALQGLHWVAAALRFLPEREEHRTLFDMADAIAEHLDDYRIAPEFMVRFEVRLLQDLGFGLDLSACAATGAKDDLIYVSPKSGRAVGRTAGAPWRERLLTLPAFLRESIGDARARPDDIEAGFLLTKHFLRRDLFEPRGVAPPECRDAFIEAARKNWTLAD